MYIIIIYNYDIIDGVQIIYNHDIIDGVHISRTEREVHWYEQQGKKKWDEHGMLKQRT